MSRSDFYSAPKNSRNLLCRCLQALQKRQIAGLLECFHIIGSSLSAPAWTGVVWSNTEKQSYAESDAEMIKHAYFNFIKEL